MTNSSEHSVLFDLQHVFKTYTDGNVSAVVDTNLTVERGEYLAIVGPSGSGKSSLLNILGGLDRPDRGEVVFDGEPLSRIKRLDRVRAFKMGFVFQTFHLLPTLTALENVQIPMFEGNLGPAARREKARALLDAVGLSHRSDHLPSRLSVGERQRIAIARSLANEPIVMLADEPTGNLDSASAEDVLSLFDRLRAERDLTLVVVTHSSELATRADRVVSIRDGRIVSDTGRVPLAQR